MKNIETLNVLRKTARNRAFTILEILAVVATVGVIAMIALTSTAQVFERTANQKLRSDVDTLNRGVNIYRANGGDLSTASGVTDVLAHLKSQLSASHAAEFVGLTSSMVDIRVAPEFQTAAEALTGQLRAHWDAAGQRFVISESGRDGVKRFFLDEEQAGARFADETRLGVFRYAVEDDWIWDYEDRTRPTGKPLTDVPLSPAGNSTVDGVSAVTPTPNLSGVVGFSMSVAQEPATLTASPGTFITKQDGNYNAASTWVGNVRPPDRLGSRQVIIQHRVRFGDGDDLYVESGKLTVKSVLYVDDKNIKMERAAGQVNIEGLIMLSDGNFGLKTGTVNFKGGGIQSCNGNYTDESPTGGTNGHGYIYIGNGDITNLGAAPFSSSIAWCIDDGDGVFLPTTENTSVAKPPGGCLDEAHYKTAVEKPVRLKYTYTFSNNTSGFLDVAFSNPLPGGLTWDTSYLREESNNITTSGLEYDGAERTATIAHLTLPPGNSSFTLATSATNPGVHDTSIVNRATITSRDPEANGSHSAEITTVLPAAY